MLCAALHESVLDPQQTFRSVFVWFRNMRGGLLSVSIRGGRPKSEPPAVWMKFAQEPCFTWDVRKQCNNSGGNSYENSVTGWCTGGCWFRYRHADLHCTRVSSSCR